MHKNLFVVLLIAVLAIAFLAVPVAAQENCPSPLIRVEAAENQAYAVLAAPDPNSKELGQLANGTEVCPLGVANGNYVAISSPYNGWLRKEAFPGYQPVQPTPAPETLNPEATAPAAQQVYVPVPDFSWMLATPEWVTVNSSANVRNAPDEQAVLLGTIGATTDPVVQVLARFEGRSLVRSANLFGWVNDQNAFPDGVQAGTQPEWFSTKRGKGVVETCVQIVEQVVVYAPAGDVLTDLTLYGGDDSVVGHGTEVRSLDDHYVVVLRENGVYNVLMTRNGVWQRAEGDAWVCEGGTPELKPTDAGYIAPWLLMEPADAMPGTKKASIGLEFGIKDAFVHSQIPYDPGVYHFVELDGTTRDFTQAEILAFPQAVTVAPNAMVAGQGGGSSYVPPLAQANCTISDPVEVVVQGEIVEGNLYKAAIGTPEVSCYNLALFVDEDTPQGELEAEAWQGQAQNFLYQRDNIIVVQFPSGMDAAEMRAWVEANLANVMQRMRWTDRKAVTFNNVPGYNQGEKVTLSK